MAGYHLICTVCLINIWSSGGTVNPHVPSPLDERRMHGLEVLSARLVPADRKAAHEVARVLHMLTRFETFDDLAAGESRFAEVIPVV